LQCELGHVDTAEDDGDVGRRNGAASRIVPSALHPASEILLEGERRPNRRGHGDVLQRPLIAWIFVPKGRMTLRSVYSAIALPMAIVPCQVQWLTRAGAQPAPRPFGDGELLGVDVFFAVDFSLTKAPST
jgi:hypothetical protein